MSTIQEIVTQNAPSPTVKSKAGESVPTAFLKFLCSVRFGVTLLVLLGLACLIGMLVMQQNVSGFDRYFAELTPSQRLVYGKLGIFDIYHSWYFNALLAVLSLNIILASVDRIPKAWVYFSRPSITVPVRWLREQKQTAALTMKGDSATLITEITGAMRKAGWKKVSTGEKAGKTYVFGQSGTWNRLGAYAVHVGLLTIFVGGFMTAQMGSNGSLPLSPGETTNLMSDTVVDLDQTREITKRLPFDISCVDIQQKLIKKEESLSAMNTIDWMTRFTITDETGTHEAFVQMNRPFDYRGYRFFQSSFTSIGRARNITVKAKPAAGGNIETVTIDRNGSANLTDGTKLTFSEFRGNFRMGAEDPNESTSDYQNPAAVLKVTQSDSPPQTAYAFGPLMGNIPIASKPVAGYTFELTDFEKVADQHILSVQRDPGATVVYVGFVLLFLTLVGVFFFSHQRVWAVIEHAGGTAHNIVLGGHTNRNTNALDEKFRHFYGDLTGPTR